MKVKELIEKLQKCDGENRVVVNTSDGSDEIILTVFDVIVYSDLAEILVQNVI